MDREEGMSEEHKPRVYGRCGIPEDPARCIEAVSDRDPRWPSRHQCQNKRGHGPGGLYCRIHDPAVIAERRKKQDQKWAAERKRDREKMQCVEMGRRLMRAGIDSVEKVDEMLKALTAARNFLTSFDNTSNENNWGSLGEVEDVFRVALKAFEGDNLNQV